MNIKNPELIKLLANFKPFFSLTPSITTNGQFIPVAWSRGILLEPNILRLLAKEFLPLIDWNKIDVIAGIELQGVSLATALSLETNKPMVIAREKPKRVGRSAIVGDVNFIFPGCRVLLVDDLMAYGGTKEIRIKLLEEKNAKVDDLAVFIYAEAIPPTKPLSATSDYDNAGVAWLKKRGVKLYLLIDYAELGKLQFEAGTISKDLFEVLKTNTDGPYWEKAENLERLYGLMKKENAPIEDFVLQFMKEHGVKI